MLARSLIFFFSICVVANATHPKHRPIGGITQRFGAADVFAFIPGITKQGNLFIILYSCFHYGIQSYKMKKK
jgi:hypothetical protein